jgi:hypothetical protein
LEIEILVLDKANYLWKGKNLATFYLTVSGSSSFFFLKNSLLEGRVQGL